MPNRGAASGPLPVEFGRGTIGGGGGSTDGEGLEAVARVVVVPIPPGKERLLDVPERRGCSCC